jgi:hypothetical protein
VSGRLNVIPFVEWAANPRKLVFEIWRVRFFGIHYNPRSWLDVGLRS